MLKICSKPQNKARMWLKFVHGQKNMIFCSKELFWKGLWKSTPPGTQASKNLSGPIGLITDEICFEICFEKVGDVKFPKIISKSFDWTFPNFFWKELIGIGLMCVSFYIPRSVSCRRSFVPFQLEFAHCPLRPTDIPWLSSPNPLQILFNVTNLSDKP